MADIDKIAQQFQKLSLTEAEALDQRLHAYINSLKESGQHQPTEESTPDKIIYEEAGWTYQQKFVKCGKPNCRCASGEKHGPYLYRAKYENGKTKWQYVRKL